MIVCTIGDFSRKTSSLLARRLLSRLARGSPRWWRGEFAAHGLDQLLSLCLGSVDLTLYSLDLRLGVDLGLLDLPAHVGGTFGQASVSVDDRFLDGRLGGSLRGGDRLPDLGADFLQLGAGCACGSLGLLGRGLAGR